MAFNPDHRDQEYFPLRGMQSPGPPSYDLQPSGSFSSERKPAPYRLRSRKRKPDFWAWEWMALLVSLCAVIGSGITLLHFDNKKIPKWSWRTNGISVNSILSLLSTLSRGSLMLPLDECMGQLMWLRFAMKEQRLSDIRAYNEAVRGPLGALKLLMRQKGLGLGCLGAFLLIGSLGIGTAQQQLLSYPSRSFIDPTINSTVTRAQSFNTYQNITSFGTTTPTLSNSLLSSIYSAALLPDTRNASTAFEILPFFTCTSGTCVFPSFTTLAICSECHDATPQVHSSCDTTGLCTAEFSNLTSQSWQVNTPSFINTLLNQSTIPTASVPISFKNPFALFAHLQVNSSSWPPTYTGTQCALTWCTQTLNASVTNGIYTQAVTATNTTFTTTADGGILFAGPTENTTYSVSPGAQQSIVGAMGVPAVLGGWARSTPSGDWREFSSDLMQGFSAYADVGRVMGRVATAMSNRVRDLDMRGGVSKGQTMGTESYIKVRWAWLLYPVTLWTLSLVFLVCIAVRSKRGEKRWGMRAWGASPLAVLFYGLDEETRERVAEGEWEEMGDLAERLWVKLEGGREGLRLRGRKVEG